MEQTRFKVHGYRWIMLLAFMFAAAMYYGVSDLSIGLLSLSFMSVYIVISIPA